RGSDCRGAVRKSQTSLHPRPDGLDAGGDIARREGGRAAERNPRHGAVADQPAARLRLCAALSVRDRPLPCRISAARGLWRPSFCGVLARRGIGGGAMTEVPALLEVTDLVKYYAVRGGILRRRIGTVHSVDGVSFSIA